MRTHRSNFSDKRADTGCKSHSVAVLESYAQIILHQSAHLLHFGCVVASLLRTHADVLRSTYYFMRVQLTHLRSAVSAMLVTVLYTAILLAAAAAAPPVIEACCCSALHRCVCLQLHIMSFPKLLQSCAY
eukprot:9582-Heterococcus_DN1.PRE.6